MQYVVCSVLYVVMWYKGYYQWVPPPPPHNNKRLYIILKILPPGPAIHPPGLPE